MQYLHTGTYFYCTFNPTERQNFSNYTVIEREVSDLTFENTKFKDSKHYSTSSWKTQSVQCGVSQTFGIIQHQYTVKSYKNIFQKLGGGEEL